MREVAGEVVPLLAAAPLQRSRTWQPPQPMVVASALVILIVVACAAVPGLLADGDPNAVDLEQRLLSPSRHHWFGTDQYGRDILLRVVHGARVSVVIALAATALALAIGLVIGLLAGYAGGAVDAALTWLLDVVQCVPAFVLALVIVASLGAGTAKVVLAIGLAFVPLYARVVRAEVLSVRERLFIDAARVSGTRTSVTLVRHVAPNAAPAVLVLATIGLGGVMLAASALSFLGLGPLPPSPEWGAMLNDGRRFIEAAWWIPLFPGLVLMATAFALNVLGQWLREQL